MEKLITYLYVVNKLTDIALACKNILSREWKATYADFLHHEHLRSLAQHVLALLENDWGKFHDKPHFEKEIIPDLKIVSAAFKEQWSVFKKYNFHNQKITRHAFATAVENTPFAYLLILIGQRITPASIQDERAIPPLQHELLNHSFQPHNSQISKAVRAWEKHAQRTTDGSWGMVKGTPIDKEKHVHTIVKHILQHKTWWNVFTHYKHDIVYEARIESGHGIRWKKDTLELIGFVEPFQNNTTS